MHRVCYTLVSLLCTITVLTGCEEEQSGSEMRTTYNLALDGFESGDFETAATRFGEARIGAGQDTELRFNSAFNLGIAKARQVDMNVQSPEELEKARAILSESAAWFQTAIQLRPTDPEVRKNLEIVMRRILALSDRINSGKNGLEPRLDEAIESQRGQRDQIRALMMMVSQSGNTAEPIEFQKDFDGLATNQRSLLSDVNMIAELAGDELSLLQDKAGQDGAELSDEDKVRLAQLSNLDFYLQRARGDLGDARRGLRRLQGDRAHRLSDGGLRFLVRAREQLHDPVTVLKSVAQDQNRLLMQTAALARLDKQDFAVQGVSIETDDKPENAADNPSANTTQTPPPLKAPVWLTNEHLSERQDGALQRTREVLARFESIDAHKDDPDDPADTANPTEPVEPEDPKQARTMQSARDAVPFLKRATEHMESARTALTAGKRDQATRHETDALLALAGAIERFSDIRGLIELIAGDHQQSITLLTPLEVLLPQLEAHGADPAMLEKLKTMDGGERKQLLTTAVNSNIERLLRLQGLFDDELKTLESQAAQAAQAGPAPGAPNAPADPNAPDPQQQQLEGQKQRYIQAEELRKQAFDSITELSLFASSAGSTDAGATSAEQALAVAEQGKQHIDELRRLFYSLIEHLQELVQEQTKTNDATGSAASAIEPEDIINRLGPALEAQREHAAMGEPLTAAVAEQADKAGQSEQPDQEQIQRLTEATEELRSATEQMTFAATQMTEDLETASSSSVDLSTSLEAQRTAITHLEAALQLLQPPQQDQQQNQDQDQQDQGEDGNKQKAERQLQEIRDREAERRREQQQQGKSQPVAKDW